MFCGHYWTKAAGRAGEHRGSLQLVLRPRVQFPLSAVSHAADDWAGKHLRNWAVTVDIIQSGDARASSSRDAGTWEAWCAPTEWALAGALGRIAVVGSLEYSN